MALLAEVVWFNTGTSTSTVPVSHSLGETPKAIIFITNGLTGSGAAQSGADDLDMSIGFCNGTAAANNKCITVSSDQGFTRARCQRKLLNGSCVAAINFANGSSTGEGAVDAWDSDSFDFTPSNAFGADRRIMAIVLGGDAITNTDLDVFTAATSTGTQDITAPGFDDTSCVFFASIGAVTEDSGVANSNHMFGVGCTDPDSNTKQAVTLGSSDDQADPTDTYKYIQDAECLSIINAVGGSIVARAEYNGAITNGFQLNWLEAATAWDVIYLALGGVSANILTGDCPDTSGSEALSGAGFSPDALILACNRSNESTQDAADGHDHWTIGFGTSTSNRGGMGARDYDNVGFTTISTRRVEDGILCNADETTSGDDILDIGSIDSDGATFVLDGSDDDGMDGFFWALMLGEAAGATTKTIVTSLDAAIRRQSTIASSLDAAIRAPDQTVSTSLDAAIQAQATLQALLDAVVQRRDTLVTVSLDAAVRIEDQTLTTDLDAVIARTTALTVSLDAVVQQLDAIVTTSLDAAIRQPGLTLSADLDAAIRQAGITVTTALDAYIVAVGGGTITTNLDAAIRAPDQTVVTSLDAAVRRPGLLITTALDAVIQLLQQTVTVSLDAVVQRTGTISTALDAYIVAAGENTIVALLDAAIRQPDITLSTALDAAVRLADQLLTTSLDAVVRAEQTVTTALDAVLRATFTRTVELDAAIRQPAQTLITALDAYIVTTAPITPSPLRTFLVEPGHRSLTVSRDPNLVEPEDRT